MQVQKISDTIQKFDGVSYYRCGPYFQRKGKRLHRMVWEFHNGPIPTGYDIHHINGDRADNDIENLQMLKEQEHGSLHMSTPARKEKSRHDVKKAIEAAREWHASEAGVAWHSAHAKETWDKTEPTEHTCTNCGKAYQSFGKYGRSSNTFCSNNCKSAWRRKRGIDNETRTCPVCGVQFSVSKYAKTVCCGAECARKRRWGR